MATSRRRRTAPRVEQQPTREPYVPRGAAFDLLHSWANAVLVSGPAGTGKSVASLFKLHLCAEHNPGFRGLVCRRTRKSLTDTGLVTFERDVLPPVHAARGKVQRQGRHSYLYPNGSEIVVGGLDSPSSIMSGDYDMIFIQEATEVGEEAYEMLTTRLGRNPQMGYQQILMDCNPDRPTHWLYQRSGPDRSGKSILRLESRHEDNPRLWDANANQWTPEGVRYVLGVLENLTGPRKQRLRYGRWVKAEGVVYENWDANVHLIDPFDVPPEWPRVWAIDWGYTNPFSWSHWALDGDNRLFCVQQIYRTKKTVKEHCDRIKEITKGMPRPIGIVVDPADAEGRATFTAEMGLPTIPAEKLNKEKVGIQAVERRLAKDGSGSKRDRRLYIFRDSLDEVDPDLAEAKLPTSGAEEFDALIWDVAAGKKERPVDRDNHFLDAVRYLCFALDCPSPRSSSRPTVYHT